MEVIFTKTGKKFNWVKAVILGKSVTEFQWPAHPGLPHDLVHCIVEPIFGLSRGYWGLIANGTDYSSVTRALELAKTKSTTQELTIGEWNELYISEILVASFQTDLWEGEFDAQKRRELVLQHCGNWKLPFPNCYDDTKAKEAEARLAHCLIEWNELEIGNSMSVNVFWN